MIFARHNFHFFLILHLFTQTYYTKVFRVLLFGGLFCLFLYYAIPISHRNNSKHKDIKKKHCLVEDEATASYNEFIVLTIDTVCGYPHIVSTIQKKKLKKCNTSKKKNHHQTQTTA